jgi:hypothetical protein
MPPLLNFVLQFVNHQKRFHGFFGQVFSLSFPSIRQLLNVEMHPVVVQLQCVNKSHPAFLNLLQASCVYYFFGNHYFLSFEKTTPPRKKAKKTGCGCGMKRNREHLGGSINPRAATVLGFLLISSSFRCVILCNALPP